MDLSPLNLGIIAAYYYITYTTIELFSSSVTPKTKARGLLEIISSASEFDALPLRPGEEEAVRKLLLHAPLALDKPRFTDPHVKANALLQAHFSRRELPGDLGLDQRGVVEGSVRLLHAMVDVIASLGWLSPVLVAMEMCQMVVQGMWDKDSPLLQLPHMSPELAKRCAAAGVASIFDLLDMEDDARQELLQMSDGQLAEVAAVCNRYPDITLSYEVAGGSGAQVVAGENVTLQVSLARDLEGELAPVHAPRYPGAKEEAWWLVVGDAKSNAPLGIKRVSLGKAAKVKLDFTAPAEPGRRALTLSFMCDSWLGCDQEYELELTVVPGAGAEEEAEEEEAEEAMRPEEEEKGANGVAAAAADGVGAGRQGRAEDDDAMSE